MKNHRSLLKQITVKWLKSVRHKAHLLIGCTQSRLKESQERLIEFQINQGHGLKTSRREDLLMSCGCWGLREPYERALGERRRRKREGERAGRKAEKVMERGRDTQGESGRDTGSSYTRFTLLQEDRKGEGERERERKREREREREWEREETQRKKETV